MGKWPRLRAAAQRTARPTSVDRRSQSRAPHTGALSHPAPTWKLRQSLAHATAAGACAAEPRAPSKERRASPFPVTGEQRTPVNWASGQATGDGTRRFAARHRAAFAPDFYRTLNGGVASGQLHVSSLGLGTYRGDCGPADDTHYATAVRQALADGINVLDAAINYRCQRSERAIGSALAAAIVDAVVARDEIVVCTKGGYIPLDGAAPSDRSEYHAYLRRAYFDPGIMSPEELVGDAHCLSPSFLRDQIDRSRANLGLATLDLYYLHNPEQQLDAIDQELFASRLRAAFALLEDRCIDGEIGFYGCATWSGLRVPPESRGHLSVALLARIAREVGGTNHHFRVIQLPINLALTEAVRTPTQRLDDGRLVTVLEAAAEMGLGVVASSTLYQARLASGLPAAISQALPGLDTDAQRAIAFVRGLPVVTTALVGMKTANHVRENLAAARAAP